MSDDMKTMLQFLEPQVLLALEGIGSVLRTSAYNEVQALLDDQNQVLGVYSTYIKEQLNRSRYKYETQHEVSYLIIDSPLKSQLNVYLEFQKLCDVNLVYLRCTSEVLVSYILQQVPCPLNKTELVEWFESNTADAEEYQRFQRYMER
jgi:hypothetical protein